MYSIGCYDIICTVFAPSEGPELRLWRLRAVPDLRTGKYDKNFCSADKNIESRCFALLYAAGSQFLVPQRRAHFEWHRNESLHSQSDISPPHGRGVHQPGRTAISQHNGGDFRRQIKAIHGELNYTFPETNRIKQKMLTGTAPNVKMHKGISCGWRTLDRLLWLVRHLFRLGGKHTRTHVIFIPPHSLIHS